MSEERRAAPAPGEAAVVTPDLDATSLPQGGPAAEDARPPPRSIAPESSPGLRRRGRMALRIPDDEVARPADPGADSAPPPPAVVDALPALVPMRIIAITETFADAPPPPAAEVPPPAAEAPPRPAAEAPAPASSDDVDDARATPVPVSAEPLSDDDATLPLLPHPPSTPGGAALEPEGEEIRFEDDAMTPALPRADAIEAHDRISDPGDAPEVSVEDVVAVEVAPPPARVDLPPVPPAVPAASRAPTPSRPPLVIVPAASAHPPPPDAAPRRKARLWWEELFNDDYLRTMEKLTERQIAREADFIEESLGVERGGAVLDLACGTGLQAIELARRGYDVVGFDASPAMLSRAGDEAQGRAAKLSFVQGDMREMTFDERFDGVYCWNTGFGYFDEEKNALVVDRVHHALKAGGLFLLDVVNRDFILRQSPSLAWFEGDGCVCMDEMNVDVITSRMKVKRTLMLDDGRSREIEYSMRVYSLHELGKILHDHGFKVCEVSGRVATPGVFFGSESPRTIILAEKK